VFKTRGQWCFRDADLRTEQAIWLLRRLPYRDYLRTAHWSRVRDLALERDRFVCALCQATDRLQIHHRSYVRKGFEQPEDVVVPCEDCHGRHPEALVAARMESYTPRRAPLVPASSIRWLIKGVS
jgi:5-methylcytosine-specific restriction endonuclease McrA